VPEGRGLKAYQERAVPLPGWVTEYIGERCKKHGVFVACNTFESDPEWPGRVFNTSFIVDPDGKVILRYRKNNDSQTGIPVSTNPGDFYQSYVAHYGEKPEALFPVVDTEIGRLACMTCYDIRFAEVARCLALQGAEVIIHPTAEGSGPIAWRQSWDFAKQVRAWENTCFFISTNNGRTFNSIRPEGRQRGLSKIIDFEGRVLAETDGIGETAVTATIDLELLRQARTMPFNVIATSRFGTYLPMYEKYQTWPLDSYEKEPLQHRDQAGQIGRRVLQDMYERDQCIPPANLPARRGPF
jgi:predicted amidohydrolase